METQNTIWKKYPHIIRLDDPDAAELLLMPNIWVEPKIDGANASILIDYQGVLRAAKRSQVLGNGVEFKGLVAHTYENQDRFMAFFAKYPQHVIYGEWLVPHTLRCYRESAWNKFYAFDIKDLTSGRFYDPETRVHMLSEFDINQVPPMARLDGPLVTEKQLQHLQYYANNNRFLIDDPNTVGEGVIIKAFSADGESFKVCGHRTWAKIVRQEFREKNNIAFNSPHIKSEVVWEMVFVDTFVTEGRVKKIQAKVLDNRNSEIWENKYLPELFNRVELDLFEEELCRFVSKNKIGKWNFKDARTYMIVKIKTFLGI